MKSLGLVAAAVAMLFAAGAQASGNITATLGTRVLDTQDWEPTEKQAMFGVLGDFQLGRSPVHLEWGLRASADDAEESGVDVSLAVADLSLGALFIGDRGVARPYFGLGVASVGVGLEVEGPTPTGRRTEDDDDQSLGYYLATGVMFRIGRSFNLGVDARWLGGTEVTLFDEEGNTDKADVDSYTIGLRVGWGWDSPRSSAPAVARAAPMVPPTPVAPAVAASLPDTYAAKLSSVVNRCNELLSSNSYPARCTLADAPAGYPQLKIPFPTPADSNRNNSTVSAQLVDPFCQALLQAGQSGTVLVTATSIGYGSRYDCGLRSWSAWVPR